MTLNCLACIVLDPGFEICRQKPRDGGGCEYQDGTRGGQDPERSAPEIYETAPARGRLRIFTAAFNLGLGRSANVDIQRHGALPRTFRHNVHCPSGKESAIAIIREICEAVSWLRTQ